VDRIETKRIMNYESRIVNNFFKTIRIIGVSLILYSLFMLPTLAATTVSFQPISVEVTEGERFEIRVTLDPAGVTNYTVKITLNYSADLVRVESFTFNESLIPLNQPGFFLTDNAGGILIRTGGFPGGVSSPVLFGAVTFVARKTGRGTITMGADSLVLDAENKNLIDTGPVSTSVTINPFTPAVLPEEIPAKNDGNSAI